MGGERRIPFLPFFYFVSFHFIIIIAYVFFSFPSFRLVIGLYPCVCVYY